MFVGGRGRAQAVDKTVLSRWRLVEIKAMAEVRRARPSVGAIRWAGLGLKSTLAVGVDG